MGKSGFVKMEEGALPGWSWHGMLELRREVGLWSDINKKSFTQCQHSNIILIQRIAEFQNKQS